MNRGCYRNILVAGAVIASAALWCSEGYAAPKWWNKAWPYRRALQVSRQVREQSNTGLALCTFGAGEEVKPGGRGIRVTDSAAKLLPHTVIYAEPGKQCQVVFATNGPGTYYVYYGNRNAGPGSKQLKLDRGLILETRDRPEGGCGSWKAYQSLLRKSKVVYGRGVRSIIFDGFNPYGPSDNYMSIYKGHIYCDRAGEYRFATNSDDSSFVFIDGKKVVEWAGVHGASGAYGQHNGSITLTKGFHRIEYYHEDSGGSQACVLGWWTPGAQQVCLVPGSAFPSFLRAKVYSSELVSSKVCADYSFRHKSNLNLPGNLYCEVKFFDRSSPEAPASAYSWDFGDEIASEERNPVHIYLAPGFYPVTLTVTGPGGKKDKTLRRIYAGMLSIDTGEKRRAQMYAESAKDYDWDKLNTKGLLGALALYKFAGDIDAQVQICEALIKHGSELKSKQRYKVLLQLGDLLRNERRDADGALAAYQQIIDETTSKKRMLMGQIGVADVTFQLKKEYDKALKIYQEIIEKYKEVSLPYCRLAQIRIGDLWRERGHYNNALVAYQKSHDLRRGAQHVDESLRRGELAIAAESYLRRNNYEAALKKLDLWDWEFPEDKLSGYPSILRARARCGLQKFDRAIEDLNSLVKANSGDTGGHRSNYLAEAKFIIAYALLKQEKYQAAAQAAQQMIKEHPESDLLQKARDLLEQARKRDSNAAPGK